MFLKYHCKLSGRGMSGRRCTASRITLIRTIQVVSMLKRRLWPLLPSCKSCIAGWCLSSTITIPAVWRVAPVKNLWTKTKSPLTLDSACSRMNRHFNSAGMHSTVDLRWLSDLLPTQRSTVSVLGGLCFLHTVDRLQWTIWTACSSHWKEITGIAPSLYWMYCDSLRRLKYWSWLM